MNNIKRGFYLLVSVFILFACTPNLPNNFSVSDNQIEIYPDYSNTTIPNNIAPMNFRINAEADNYITNISATNGESLTIKGNEVRIKKKKWEKMLGSNSGELLTYEIYLKNKGEWKKYSFANSISNEPIDNYISYRLIEPSYKLFKKISINQRNLTSFDEDKIYSSTLKWQCVNCHSYQNYNQTGNMNLHLRGNDGGTIITHEGTMEKINLKTEELPRGGAYVSWHPDKKIIAYSINAVGQFFHSKDKQKVEVIDSYSDLILYDVDKNEVSYIIKSEDRLETYPCWAPNGKSLYFVSAKFSTGEGDAFFKAKQNYKELKYNIYQMSFNPDTKVFGEPNLVFDASAYDKSAVFPRISPDGKYLMFTMSDYGCFPIWHNTADLFLMNLETKEVKNMDIVNSSNVESYHSWSSNGRWFIFSSRRDDGSYTRFYISYFDKSGTAHKPFILPQKHTGFYKELFKSYNIPEFMVAPVEYSYREFAIDGPAKNAVYMDQ